MSILTGKFDMHPTFEGDDFRKAWIEDPEQNAQFLKDLEAVDHLRAAIPNRPPAEVAIKFLGFLGASKETIERIKQDEIPNS